MVSGGFRGVCKPMAMRERGESPAPRDAPHGHQPPPEPPGNAAADNATRQAQPEARGGWHGQRLVCKPMAMRDTGKGTRTGTHRMAIGLKTAR